jgi:superfamily I DNA/RNA helicase
MKPEERLEFTKQLGTGIRGVGEKRWMQAYEKTTATTFYLPEIVTVKALAKKYGKVDFDTLVQKPLEEQIEIVTRMTTGKTSNAVAQNILTVMNHRPDFIDAIKNPPAAISTVHKFKGKQDARIVLIGANEKLMPHERGELEEERRLLFVAATRSEGDVDIFFNRQSPSRFLNEMAT